MFALITGFATVVLPFVRNAVVPSAFSWISGRTSPIHHADALNSLKSTFPRSIVPFSLYGSVTVIASPRSSCVLSWFHNADWKDFAVVFASDSAFALLSFQLCVPAVTKRDSISLGMFTAFHSIGSSYFHPSLVRLYSSNSVFILPYSFSTC